MLKPEFYNLNEYSVKEPILNKKVDMNLSGYIIKKAISNKCYLYNLTISWKVAYQLKYKQ